MSNDNATSTLAGPASFVDDRLTSSNFVKRSLNKIFPDHWSFMLGEIALYSFIILLVTGVFLSLWFKPAMSEVIYNGSYVPLKGLRMSEAYASTLDISFDIRGGLVMRQIHHWSALIFVASISVHLMRIFFTGAFRKPREINWIIGIGLLTMALLEGFAGYSLPDDLLSGTGLRIAAGIVQSIPVVGTYVSFFLFDGQFPGEAIVSRLYTVHVLLVPGLILALITAHLMMVWYQKHTQYPGPGRTEDNVVGYPVLPVYAAKAGGFFALVFAVTAFLGAFATINPIWAYGPYNPSQVTAGAQPDWYIGWLEGGLRMMPNLETRIWGVTLSWNVLFPALILPGIMFTLMALYPFIEAWVTGDKRAHNLLDRPRNQPVRTALGAMSLSFYVILWINGGNDIIAISFDLSINAITWAMRFALIIAPPIVFVITKRICLGLQRKDRNLVLHGRETGRLVRLPEGEFVEVHEPIPASQQWQIVQHETHLPAPASEATDERGIRNPTARKERLRARLSRFYFGDHVLSPREEALADTDDAKELTPGD